MWKASDQLQPLPRLGAFTPKIWRGKKRPKFGAILDNFKLLSRISAESITILKKNQKSKWSTTVPPTLREKNIWWTLVH